MSEAAFAEIGPISKDGEDMFRMIIMPFGGKVVRFDSERDMAVVKFPDSDAIDTLEMPGYFVTTLAEDPTAPKPPPAAEEKPVSIAAAGTEQQPAAADTAGGSPRSSGIPRADDDAGVDENRSKLSGGLQTASFPPRGLGGSSANDTSSAASTTTASSTYGGSSVAMRKRVSPIAACSGWEPLPASDPFYLLTDVNIACPLSCGFLLLYTLVALVGIV